VMDAYSRMIVGWSIAGHMRTELVTDALGMAIIRRQPDKQPGDTQTILHPDHGSQYTSWAFGQRLRATGLLTSMGTVGDCYDNAMMESFWAPCNSSCSTRKNGKPATNLPTPSSNG
jgi:putative transposase